MFCTIMIILLNLSNYQSKIFEKHIYNQFHHITLQLEIYRTTLKGYQMKYYSTSTQIKVIHQLSV